MSQPTAPPRDHHGEARGCSSEAKPGAERPTAPYRGRQAASVDLRHERELARLFGVSRSRVRQLHAEGKLKRFELRNPVDRQRRWSGVLLQRELEETGPARSFGARRPRHVVSSVSPARRENLICRDGRCAVRPRADGDRGRQRRRQPPRRSDWLCAAAYRVHPARAAPAETQTADQPRGRSRARRASSVMLRPDKSSRTEGHAGHGRRRATRPPDAGRRRGDYRCGIDRACTEVNGV